jgi:hypothetical protein
MFGSSFSGICGISGSLERTEQKVSLKKPNYNETTSKERQKPISEYIGILIAFGLCIFGGFIQFAGLQRMTKNRTEGTAIWLIGAALGFAGPFGILWGIIMPTALPQRWQLLAARQIQQVAPNLTSADRCHIR